MPISRLQKYLLLTLAMPLAPVAAGAGVNLGDLGTVQRWTKLEVDLPGPGVEGVLAAQGSGFGGWSLYAKDGELRYVHNFVARDLHEVSAPLPADPGPHSLAFHFERTGENAGVGRLVVDGAAVGEVEIPDFTPVRWAITGEGLCCGRQLGLPVTRDYRGPFPFTGTLHRVTVEVDGPRSLDVGAEADLAFRAQ